MVILTNMEEVKEVLEELCKEFEIWFKRRSGVEVAIVYRVPVSGPDSVRVTFDEVWLDD